MAKVPKPQVPAIARSLFITSFHDSFHNYRRRSEGTVLRKGILQVDNGDVVPCNSYLLLKYNARSEVEIRSSARFVKYLFNYVCKRYDSAYIEFVSNVIQPNGNNTVTYDEAVNFANMRYVSSHDRI